MRFTTTQENEHGLSESQPCIGTDENVMDTTNDTMHLDDNRNTSLGKEEGSMISNLPLLFANGYPTSLEKITMEELERFVTFMVHCSLGHDTTRVINKPQWWPQDIKFSNPLLRPKKINDNWMANLKKLVFRCYTYHRSEYLLRFCSYLARYPHNDLEYVNNWDSTTSLYQRSAGKLLVTFRNENMNYDKKSDCPRRTLLSHNGSSSGHSNKTKQPKNALMMVQPSCEDIYLCDNCDAEFIGLEKMKEHEKICCEQDHGNCRSRPSTPDISVVEPELQQNQFLEYFQLSSNKTEVKPIGINSTRTLDNNIARRTSRRVRKSLNFAKCATIPFSSPAGMLLAKKCKAMTEDTQQERLERIERYLIAPVLSNLCRPKWLDIGNDHSRWMVTYKSNRDRSDNYVHQYQYSKFSKRKPMLSIRSQLLYLSCRPIYVALSRLSQKQINEIKENISKYKYLQNTNTQQVSLVRRIGPACKTRLNKIIYAQNALTSSECKDLGDETNPITLEDEGINIYSPASNTEKANVFPIVNSSTKNKDSTNPIKEKTSTSAIMLIDLCSSDEEDIDTLLSCDENRDPMNSAESQFTKSLLRKLTPNKLYTKPCSYSPDSSKNWLSNNVLNEDKIENCTNKCRTGVLNLSPLLRPGP